MSTLYTRCTHCDTLFELTLEELNAAAGVVRCGVCRETFDAKLRLTEEIPGENARDAAPGEDADGPAPPLLQTAPGYLGDDTGDDTDDDTDDDTGDDTTADTENQPPPAASGMSAPGHDDDITIDDGADRPVDERTLEGPETLLGGAAPGPRSAAATLAWSAASLLLLILLAGQAAYHWRDELLQHRRIGPVIAALNARLGGPVTLEYDPRRYAFVERPRLVETTPPAPVDVDDGPVDPPDTGATLKVLAEITNTARVPQPFPWLQLVIEDRWGRPVAARTLSPEDYLPRDGVITERPMLAPGARLAMDVDVAAPVSGTEAFAIDICLPGADGSLYCAGY